MDIKIKIEIGIGDKKIELDHQEIVELNRKLNEMLGTQPFQPIAPIILPEPITPFLPSPWFNEPSTISTSPDINITGFYRTN